MSNYYKFIITLITLSFIAFSTNLSAQSYEPAVSGTKLNQKDLIRQFFGKWKFEKAKDTIYTFECKAFKDGLDLYFTYKISGQIMMEQKGLMDYDSKSEKFIQKISNPDYPPFAMWFTSKDTCESGPLKDNLNMNSAVPDRRWEFDSPDQLILSFRTKNGYMPTLTFTRENP